MTMANPSIHVIRIGDSIYEVTVTPGEDGTLLVTSQGENWQVVPDVLDGGPFYVFRVNGTRVPVAAELQGTEYSFVIQGSYRVAEVLPRLLMGAGRSGEGGEGGTLTIKAPMPGVVKDVYVIPGQAVEKGERLLVLEAMKMNNEVRSPRAGEVREVAVTPGQRLNKGDVMLVVE